jgi:DNA-binding NarL/FixJ family response regulator
MKDFNVIIADDHRLFADGVEQIINSIEGFKVVEKVENGKILLHLLNNISADIVLLDINMPIMNGIDAASEIRLKHPEIKLVFLSMYVDAKSINKAKKNGVFGYINKGITAPDLKNAIINIANGTPTFILPSNFNETETDSKDDFASKFKLSERELEIIHLIKMGRKNKEIATELELSAYTTETHRKNIYRKLNVQSIVELITLFNMYNH